MNLKKKTQKLLAFADIQIDWERPRDIQVHNDGMYARLRSEGTLGLGESYIDGWWDCEALDVMVDKALSAKLDERVGRSFSTVLSILRARIINQQTKKRAKVAISKHYDIGNTLYKYMLDKHMIYTCWYRKDAKNLEDAQIAKMKLICDKLDIRAGMKVLDIGCGWWGFAAFVAKEYGASVVWVTLSKEQLVIAKERCAGLSVEIRLQDYRDVQEKFDRVISIGMFEHIGHKNHREYMQVVRRILKEDGLSLLHTIGNDITTHHVDPRMDKYIFPDCVVPSIAQLGKAMEGLFVMEDRHNFGADYAKTAMTWYQNFVEHRDKLKDDYDERFYRIWTYYLLISVGAFRARRNQLWQIVLSPHGVSGGYQSIR
jgi:cyclopropane-fatty-acyl-phospholipid synthase